MCGGRLVESNKEKKEKMKSSSIARSKASMISLAEAIGSRVSDLVLPGSGTAYKVAKVLIKHAWRFYRDRGNMRVEEFHEVLLRGVPDTDMGSFLEKPFSIEDYYTLLDSALHDQEEAKVPRYSKFFKALINQSIDKKYRIHLIRVLKDLTYSDLMLARNIYISSQYNFIDDHGKIAQIRRILETSDPLTSCSIQKMIGFGLISPVKQDPTDLLKILVSATFDPIELTPEAIGKKAWKEVGTVWIIVPDVCRYMGLIELLETTLEKLCIKSSNVAASKKWPGMNISMSPILVLCLDAQSNQANSPMSKFVANSQLRHKKIVKILVSPGPGGKGIDPFQDLPSVANFDFTTEDTYEAEKFKNFFQMLMP